METMEEEKNHLFSNLEGEISVEQWMKWKQMKKQSGNLLESTDDEDEEVETAHGLHLPSTSAAADSAACSKPAEANAMASLSDATAPLGLKLSGFDNDVTLKYLNGHISFTEFSEKMSILHGDKEKDRDETDAEEAKDDLDEGEEVVSEMETDGRESEEWSPRKKGHRKDPKKPKKKKTDLPKHLQGLMGEANLKFARGDHKEAIIMCLEVIRLAPQAILPFQTLGMLYEEMGDLEKSLQVSELLTDLPLHSYSPSNAVFNMLYLIAAHLNPKDAEEWARLAEMSKELNNSKQALACYTKAVKYDPSNIAYIWSRCKLYDLYNEHKKALEGYQSVLKLLPPTDAVGYWRLARDTARAYHELGDITNAMHTLQEACKEHPDLITSEDVNTVLEMQMSQKQYQESLELLIKHCGVVYQFDNGLQWDASSAAETFRDIQPLGCIALDILPIDLRVKLVICMIHLKHADVIQNTLKTLFDEDIEEMGDLYLDVAEAFMDNGLYIDAKPLLSMLVRSKTYNEAAVWLKYGDCLSSVGDLDGAVTAYGNVVSLAPSHFGARVSLSALHQQLGNSEAAIKALTKERGVKEALSGKDQMLLLHKCHLLYSQDLFEDFFQCAKHLLFSHVKEHWKPTFTKAVFDFRSRKHRSEALQYFYQQKALVNDGKDIPAESTASLDDLWDIYITLCEALWERGQREDFLDVTVLGLTNPHFLADEEKHKEAEFLCLISCLLSKQGKLAYNFIREICLKEIDNNQAWNLFNQVLLCSSDGRHNRFCLRLMMKYPESTALGLLNAHNSMVAGTYKHSLGEYVNIYRKIPKDPLVNLCIGLVFIHMSCQKFSSKKHSLVIQGLSFLNEYLELRGECQEIYYNMGRAMHQLGLLYVAVYYYKKALDKKPAIETEDGTFDLNHEIAHNLALIYKNSGSKDYARWVLQTYCVV